MGNQKATKTIALGGSGMYKQYSKDETPGIPIGPNGVLGLSFGFLGVVVVLHLIARLF